jgi:hypothetical protein
MPASSTSSGAPPPFFIVGNDRSGTTMLRLVLDRGGVAIPPESMFLVDFARVRRSGNLADPDAAAAFMRRVWDHPRVRLWGIGGDPPAVPPGLTHEEAYRFAVEAPFRAYARANGKERWADKTPLYLAHLDELDAVWPEARFVVLVRDGRDVALSLLGVPFGPNNIWAAARFWAHGIDLGTEAEHRFPGRVLSVRYEDVVADPQTGMKRVCSFVELDFDTEMLAIERTDSSKVLENQAGWFTNVWAGINQSAVGKWRERMSPRQRRVFDQVAGAQLERLGYERPDAARGEGPRYRPGRVETLAYRSHDAAMRGVNFVRLRLVQERGREVGYVLKRKLARAGH